MSTNWVSIFIPPKSPFFLGSITFDAILEETHVFDSDITDYPVESGAMVSDNIILKPVILTIKALSTDYPFVFLGIGEQRPLLSTSRSIDLFNVLINLRDARLTVDVITGLKSYPDMGIQSISVPRTEPVAALTFDITLKQIIKATAQTAKIPKEKISALVENAKDQVPEKVSEGVKQVKKLKEGSYPVHFAENQGWIEKRYQ